MAKKSHLPLSADSNDPLDPENWSDNWGLSLFDPSTDLGEWEAAIDALIYRSPAASGGPLDLGAAISGAVPGGSGDITVIDTVSFAQGGKPGGGGGGGGGGSGTVTHYFSGSANGDLGYDIWIEFKGSSWTAEFQTAFKQAAEYFTTVITADIGGGGLYRGKVIDDLYVTAELKAIDGPGGILGQAGPTSVWTATELTATGQMQFDVADATVYLNQGLWDDIVSHEMMHVLGFGSLWNYGANPLVFDNPDPLLYDEYLGAAGVAAYAASHSSAAFIPVETGGGSGTAGSHWDEQALGNELMTGYINPTNYLSDFSVKSLADLGYSITPESYYPFAV